MDHESTCGVPSERLKKLLSLGLSPDDESEASVAGPTLSVSDFVSERAHTHIDQYKTIRVIGEGGMGIVYLAEQQRPVRRLVALKEIKPGMDSARIIARFEAEQQALPLMDHRQGHGKAAQPALRDSACVCRGHQPLSE
jgi:serine/threonine protein kinase